MAIDEQAYGAPAVLVIDDEDYVADMIASALEFEGYVAHVAYNGRDGLARAQTTHVDLYIVDIMMPYVNDIALIRQLHTLKGSTPTILISAGARSLEPPANVAFVPKPFDMNRMLNLVAQMLGPAGVQ